MQQTDSVEEENKRKYSGAHYNPKSINASIPEHPGEDYAMDLLWEKFNSLQQYIKDGPLLDLCCGNARHLPSIKNHQGLRVGADYSSQFLKFGQEELQLNCNQIALVRCDATQLPFANDSFQTIFSFSSLYHIKKTSMALSECHRVLAPHGTAIFEFGNRLSLNHICCKHYPDIAKLCSETASCHLHQCIDAGFSIKEHRCFQFLPLWADKPNWLYPLLHPGWKRFMKKRIKGRMLDEWVSSMPILRNFAFRHLIVCEK